MPVVYSLILIVLLLSKIRSGSPLGHLLEMPRAFLIWDVLIFIEIDAVSHQNDPKRIPTEEMVDGEMGNPDSHSKNLLEPSLAFFWHFFLNTYTHKTQKNLFFLAASSEKKIKVYTLPTIWIGGKGPGSTVFFRSQGHTRWTWQNPSLFWVEENVQKFLCFRPRVKENYPPLGLFGSPTLMKSLVSPQGFVLEFPSVVILLGFFLVSEKVETLIFKRFRFFVSVFFKSEIEDHLCHQKSNN